VKGKPGSEAKLNKEIYSLGTSVRDKDQFIRLLKEFRIDRVVDVRRFPVSRFDYFCKDKLTLLLKENNTEYLYLGERLGGFRDKGYQEHFTTEGFTSGLERLKEVASRKRTAFICAEKFPWRCHRRFIVQVLEKERWKVIHIIDEDKTWEAKTKNRLQAQKKRTASLSLPI